MQPSPLLETWQINARINTYLLAGVPEGGLAAVAKGRPVGEQFAHIHNVRLMWLKSANPALLEGLVKLEKGSELTPELLHTSLEASASAISTLLLDSERDGKGIKGFKPHPTAFVGYLIAHESHHRGQIVLTLNLASMPVDKKILFGIWEWGSR